MSEEETPTASSRTIPTNPFPNGNKLWQLRSRAGPTPKFETPEELWEACCDYFQWVEDNPLREERAFAYRGKIVKTDLSKMRAMTLDALAVFLGINFRTWDKWRKDRPDLGPVITCVEQIIYDQKFTGAAAGLLSANIIARDLGLIEKTEARLRYLDNSTHPPPVQNSESSIDNIMARALEATLALEQERQEEALKNAREQLISEGWSPP